MKKLIIINGPNLNLLGKREPAIYGSHTFNEFLDEIKTKYPDVQLTYYQSNIEGELIDKLQEVGFSYDGIILNAAAYTHTSIGLGDAVKAIETPVVEVHISNVLNNLVDNAVKYSPANPKVEISAHQQEQGELIQ